MSVPPHAAEVIAEGAARADPEAAAQAAREASARAILDGAIQAAREALALDLRGAVVELAEFGAAPDGAAFEAAAREAYEAAVAGPENELGAVGAWHLEQIMQRPQVVRCAGLTKRNAQCLNPPAFPGVWCHLHGADNIARRRAEAAARAAARAERRIALPEHGAAPAPAVRAAPAAAPRAVERPLSMPVDMLAGADASDASGDGADPGAQVTCAVCLGSVALGSATLCPKRLHVQCRDCFAACVVEQSNLASSEFDAARWRATRATVVCPFARECGSFSDLKVARNVGAAVWRMFQRSRGELFAQSVSEALEAEVSARVSSRLAPPDTSETVDGVCRQIRDRILTLRCPRPACDAAFIDYDGCMALTCAACGSLFCALCFAATPTARGLHEHVRTCALNPTRNYYGSVALFQQVHAKRKHAQALARLRACADPAVRLAAALALHADFRDNGLPLAELERLIDGEVQW